MSQMIEALGLIETYGLVGAVEAADTGLKAANVELIGLKLVGGGLVTVMLTGDVGAVSAAVDAAGAAAKKVGVVKGLHVMARPFKEIHSLCDCTFGKTPENVIPEEAEQEQETGQGQETEATAEIKEATEPEEGSVEQPADEQVLSEEALREKYSATNLKDLRKLAGSIDELPIKKAEIRSMQAPELIDVLVEYHLKNIK